MFVNLKEFRSNHYPLFHNNVDDECKKMKSKFERLFSIKAKRIHNYVKSNCTHTILIQCKNTYELYKLYKVANKYNTIDHKTIKSNLKQNKVKNFIIDSRNGYSDFFKIVKVNKSHYDIYFLQIRKNMYNG
jgi:transaldolase